VEAVPTGAGPLPAARRAPAGGARPPYPGGGLAGAGGLGGGRCGASSVRTRVEWQETSLPTRTEPGYGERQLPPSELAISGGEKALIVWFFSLEDEKANKNLETGIFADEPTALAMRMFKCVKINIDSVTDADLRGKYGNTPTFVSMDPKGEEIALVSAKSATSRSRFKSFLTKSWTYLFEMSQKDFTKPMGKILDRLDKVSGKKTVLNAKKQRLAKRPNPAKQRALAREEAELNEIETEITRDEEAIKKSCLLKEKFRTVAPAEK
jgi:hypothetical protein